MFVVRQRQNEIVPALEVHDAQPVSLVTYTHSRHLKIQRENVPLISFSHCLERTGVANTAVTSQLDYGRNICDGYDRVRVLKSVMGILRWGTYVCDGYARAGVLTSVLGMAGFG